MYTHLYPHYYLNTHLVVHSCFTLAGVFILTCTITGNFHTYFIFSVEIVILHAPSDFWGWHASILFYLLIYKKSWKTTNWKEMAIKANKQKTIVFCFLLNTFIAIQELIGLSKRQQVCICKFIFGYTLLKTLKIIVTVFGTCHAQQCCFFFWAMQAKYAYVLQWWNN